jgi:2-succinyl-5-enolpyruvyl-6-hydroxy-3-cyclohexene-1-carboxylate synthase
MTNPTPQSSSPASDFAAALLAGFVALGVRDVVVSPGSRSQALALAAAELARAGELRLHVRIDERAAGFLALGLASETGTPVLVVVTSGTAVANLHPAVLEAHHSAVPLIVLTADRPAELRGIGANQATDQPSIFGSATTLARDIPAPTGAPGEAESAVAIAREAVAAAVGPVQLNLAFREPLSAPTPMVRIPAESRAQSPVPTPLVLALDKRTVVVAGHAAGEQAELVARQLGAPLFAEVSSGAHFGPQLVVAYRELLPLFGDQIERVVIFGHPTLSREVPTLVQQTGIETIVVRTPGAEDYNPGHAVAHFADAVIVDGESTDRAWAGQWVFASRELLDRHDAPDIAIAVSDAPKDQAAFGRAVLAGLRADVTRRDLVEAVWRMTWPHDRLVFGASRLIREADAVVSGKRIRVHANRGLAGIDGTIATGIGIATALEGAGITRVLLGDLAALHDAGGLLFGTLEVRPRIQVIVGNDNGGTLFDTLEVAGTADPAAFDRVIRTPHEANFEHLAAAYGWDYRRVSNRGELEAALTPTELPVLIEVALAR